MQLVPCQEKHLAYFQSVTVTIKKLPCINFYIHHFVCVEVNLWEKNVSGNAALEAMAVFLCY